MASFRDRLEEESADWVEEGVIDAEQRDTIVSRYEQSGRSRATQVILGIGALLVGLGAIIFVGANWGAIPVFGRLALLYGSTVAAFYAGWRMKYRTETYARLGDAVLFLGVLLTGATIFLTAQMFHMAANTHWMLLLWFLAAAPVAYTVTSRSALLLGLLLFGWWIGAYLGGGNALGVVQGFLEHIGGYLFYGLALYGTGRLHEDTRFDTFSGAYRMFGVFSLFAICFMVVVSDLRLMSELAVSPVFVLFAVAGMLVAATVLYRDVAEGRRVEAAWYGTALLLTVFTVLAGLYGEWGVSELTAAMTVFVMLYNVIYAGLVLGILYVGYEQRRIAYVNLGLLFFVLYIGYLYVTTVVAYLPKSLAFIIGGTILLAGGTYLERKRRAFRDELEADT